MKHDPPGLMVVVGRKAPVERAPADPYPADLPVRNRQATETGGGPILDFWSFFMVFSHVVGSDFTRQAPGRAWPG
jgi:hypothetical protein